MGMKKKKRVRNIIILLLVLAALGAGIAYGVRYYLASRAQSIEVTSVSDLNGANWLNYNEGMTYGMVVSDVSQSVYIPENKVINEVYVSEGDEVKIGDKLLSYDTTLLELDRELQELTVQEIDLEIESSQADLKKLKNTTPVARKETEADNTGDDTMLGPNLSLPGSSDDDEARIVPASGMMLTSQEGTEGTTAPAETAAAQQEERIPETPAETQGTTENSGQTETAAQTETVSQTETASQTEMTAQTETTAQTDAAPAADDWGEEDQLILGETNGIAYLAADQLGQDGVLGSELQKEPKQKQSLKGLLSFIRVKEPSAEEESGFKLLADTRRQSRDAAPEQANLTQQTVLLIPHFSEDAAAGAHFEWQNSYSMLVHGLNLKDDRAGEFFWAAPEGVPDEAIGGYTLVQEDKDVVRLTLHFDGRLNTKHETLAELADMYAKIELSADEITGDALTFRTEKEDSDIKIAVQKSEELIKMSEEGAEPDSGEEIESETETETESEIESETETETTGETETEEETTGEAETEEETTGESDSEAESETITETESETESETETEKKSATRNIVFDVTWYHGTNSVKKWPDSLSIDFYRKDDEEQTESVWAAVVSGEAEPVPEDSSEDIQIDEEPDTEAEPDMSDISEEGAEAGITEEAESENTVVWETEEPTVPYTTVHWTSDAFPWPEGIGEPEDYDAVLTAKNALGYIRSIRWLNADEEGTRICEISMKYLEPDDSPITRLEPLSELDYQSGENGYYYKGSGTKDDPYVFFCTDGATIKSSFVNWVLGFDEDGLVREREGCYVLLEIRESDTITGAFIKKVGLDGTILVDEGYGPGTYWIFSSDTGIVRYEEEVEEPGDDFPDDPGWDDMGETYTAEELALAIAEKEREIRKLNANKREAELKLKKYERDLENSTVVSSVEGYVKTLGASANSSEPYIVVASEGGLYLRTTVSELNLDTIEKGDQLEATSWETMNIYMATVTEVSDFPSTSNSGYFYYGSGNPNSSNYPVLAHFENTKGLTPNETVDVKYVKKQSSKSNIYLPTYYVRAENGQSYVYKVGEDGFLKKQYVHTGGTANDYVEIKSGLTTEDEIAFPYGKQVKDGAKVKRENEDEDTVEDFPVG